MLIALPELNARGRPLHPRAVGIVEKDRHAAESLAPFHHRGIEMRM
jgi:hypothetical protein